MGESSRGGRAAVIGLVGIMIGVWPATPGEAATVGCGATITSTVTLAKTLRCSDDGLHVVGADVVVDLGGYSILGSGRGAGVTVEAGSGSVTVINGTVAGFETDIDASGASSIGLHSITLKQATWSLRLDMTETVITASKILAPTTERLPVGGNVDVRDSKLVDVVIGGHSRGVTAIRNDFTRGGIFVIQHDGNVITDNTFTGAATAVRMNQSLRNTIVRNRFVGNGTGLDISGAWTANGSVVTDNEFLGNTGAGAVLGDGGSTLSGWDISRNTFRDNGAAGLWIRSNLTHPSGVPTTIAYNRFVGNGYHPAGLLDEQGAVLDDGFHVEVTGGSVLVVTGNVANTNVGHGIAAVGVVDGGGNQAKRNGASPQCLGVAC